MATLQTGSDAYGGYVVSPDFRASVDAYVHAQSVFLQLARVIPTRQRTVHLHKVSTAPSFSSGWIAEGAQKPTTDLQLARDSVTVWELASLLKWTDRLDSESFSVPSVKSLVRREIAAAASQAIDDALFQGDNTTDAPNGPEGLLTGSSIYQEVAFGTGSDLGEDLLACIRAIAVTNFKPSAIVLPAAGLYGLMSLRDNDDHPKYLSAHAASPSLWGLPLIVANNIGTSTVTDGTQFDAIVADWSRVMVFSMPTSIRISDTATGLWRSHKPGHLCSAKLSHRFTA